MIALGITLMLALPVLALLVHAFVVIGVQQRYKHVAQGWPSYWTRVLMTVDTGVGTGRVFIHGHRKVRS